MNFLEKIKNNQTQIFAVATLAGTIVGVGMFALPYVIAKSGIFSGLFLLFILAIFMSTIHLIYGGVSLKGGKHRLIFYTESFLGKKYKFIPFITSLFGILGAQIAYVLVGGGFLNNLFKGFYDNIFIWSILFLILGSVLILKGIRVISQIELVMGGFMILVVILIFLLGFNKFDYGNFSYINFENILLPYGVILFSLAGIAAVPETIELLVRGGKEKSFKKVISLGSLVPAFIYAIFIISVIGLSGSNVSKEAIAGLEISLGQKILIFGSLFGFLATFTSYITLGSYLHKLFWYDLKINKILAWLFISFIPLFFLVMPFFKDYIGIISFVGGILLAMEAILIITIYLKSRKDFVSLIRIPVALAIFLIVIFLLGIFYEIRNLFI